MIRIDTIAARVRADLHRARLEEAIDGLLKRRAKGSLSTLDPLVVRVGAKGVVTS